MSMNTENGKLLAAFIELGMHTQEFVEAQEAATKAAAKLTAATLRVDRSRAAIVELIKQHDVASPGNYGFERRLADVLAFLSSSSLRFRDVDVSESVNANASRRVEV